MTWLDIAVAWAGLIIVVVAGWHLFIKSREDDSDG